MTEFIDLSTISAARHDDRRRATSFRKGMGIAAVALFAAGAACAQNQTAAPASTSLPLASLLWSLRAMVGSWVVLTLVVGLLAWRGNLRAARSRLALWVCVLTLPLPWIAMLSGWLALELGQRSASTPPPAAAEQASAAGSMGLLAWGCAYAVLMLLNLQFSLRWLRLEPHGSDERARLGEDSRSTGRNSSALVERLSQSYGVGQPSQPGALAPADGRQTDMEQLTRDIRRLRKERNALRKALKIKHRRGLARLLPAPSTRAARSSKASADDEQNTQVLPVLREIVRRRG